MSTIEYIYRLEGRLAISLRMLRLISHWGVRDAVRGQLKVLYPATRLPRGRNPIDRNAMKTRETWNRPTDGSL